MNATDKGLLALAAKAAGHEFHFSREWHELGAPQIKSSKRWIDWNPLTNDGDALRLAVKLGLVVEIGYAHRGFVAVQTNTDNWKEFREPYGECAYAATRRAIVRAAAEIGRMK